jgi:hypothetical protein
MAFNWQTLEEFARLTLAAFTAFVWRSVAGIVRARFSRGTKAKNLDVESKQWLFCGCDFADALTSRGSACWNRQSTERRGSHDRRATDAARSTDIAGV